MLAYTCNDSEDVFAGWILFASVCASPVVLDADFAAATLGSVNSLGLPRAAMDGLTGAGSGFCFAATKSGLWNKSILAPEAAAAAPGAALAAWLAPVAAAAAPGAALAACVGLLNEATAAAGSDSL